MVPAEGEPVLSVDASPDGSAGGPPAPRIELTDVTRRYDVGDTQVTAIEDISFAVGDSAFVVILGPSGCGKTTLLNMVGALDTPTSGSVRVAGTDLTGASRKQRAEVRRHSVSFIFQTFNLFPGLTAFENVQFGADAARRDDAGDRTT